MCYLNRRTEVVRDLRGNTNLYVYDDEGRVISETDALGNQQSITVNCVGPRAGLPSSEINAEGVITHFAYNTKGQKTSEKTTRTQLDGTVLTLATAYEYDAEDRVVKTTHPDGSITRSEYNSIGKVSAAIDASGERTEYVYDTRGNETEVHHPDGTTGLKTYDAASNLLSETDAAGNLTRYEYDAANRKTATVYADATRTTTEYNAAGRVIAEVDAKGKRTDYGYDAAGRRTSVKDALGNITTYEYDAAGRMTAMVDALNRRATYSYNARDQRIKTTYADGSEVSDEFDAVSRRSAKVDQAGTRTGYGYDKLGRLTSVTDVLNQVTAYGYDESGNKTSQTDAEGRITLWDYNLAGQLSKRKLPLGQSETFTYNTLGQPLTKTDFNGAVTTYGYDDDHRLSTVTYADSSKETLEYDALGNRTTVTQTDALGNLSITTWEYNNRNHLVKETQANGAVLSYQYDTNGNRTQVKVVQGSNTQTTDYSYDALNRLASVTASEGTTSYGYDAVGNRTSVSYPNGTSQVYRYNSLNQLTKLETYGKNGALVEQYDYTLNANGQRTNISELDGRTSNYSYDALKRLTGETIADSTNGNRTTSYTYDKVGNRLTETVNSVTTNYAYDNNDRVTSAGSITYTYDANGNTLTSTEGGQASSYQYNGKNQLATLTNNQGVTQYSYNADGIRNAQSSGSATTQYVIDSNRDYAQVISETIGTSKINYTYGDDLISQSNNGQTSYYHYDGLGSTRQLSNQTGSFTDSYDYQAFGKLLNQTGNTANNYLFTGEQFDKNLDQYYLRARYYSQNTGRFTQQDEFEGRICTPITLNDYIYSHDDPVNFTDPTGMSPLFGQMQAIGLQAMTAIRSGVTGASTIRRFNAKLCAIGKSFAMPYTQLRQTLGRGSIFQAHHVFQDARAAQSVLNYKRLSAISIPLLGGTGLPGGAHRATWLLQIKEPLPNPATVNQMKAQAYRALRAAGCRSADATEIVDFASDAIELMRMGVL